MQSGSITSTGKHQISNRFMRPSSISNGEVLMSLLTDDLSMPPPSAIASVRKQDMIMPVSCTSATRTIISTTSATSSNAGNKFHFTGSATSSSVNLNPAISDFSTASNSTTTTIEPAQNDPTAQHHSQDKTPPDVLFSQQTPPARSMNASTTRVTPNHTPNHNSTTTTRHDISAQNISGTHAIRTSLPRYQSVATQKPHLVDAGHRRPTRESVLRRLSEALLRRSLTKIDMSQRYLQPSDAKLIKLALLKNSNLRTLQLGYNNLGDEGVKTLSPALGVCPCEEHSGSRIRARSKIQSLDLGFNSISDVGIRSLADSYLRRQRNVTNMISETMDTSNSLGPHCLHTLYLSGNCIKLEGALALAEMIEHGCCVQLTKFHLTGNTIGVDGVVALTKAIASAEHERSLTADKRDLQPSQQQVHSGLIAEEDRSRGSSSIGNGGIQELFLGGTGMFSMGCNAVAEMMSHTPALRVLSLADNKLTDDDCIVLARSITENKGHLPLEALQLSFNEVTCVGVEALMNAFWNSTTLSELRLDNNKIGDRGAQLVAVVMGNVRTLQRLDVGFNSFTATGIRALMKSVAESESIMSLSISGNKLDTSSAKAVAYALAYNHSLRYFFMDNCCVNHGSQRHITAGVVSNSGVCLHTITGFRVGSVAVTLGLPAALEQWTNEQVLKFIVLMWERMRQEQEEFSMAREIDPLNFLPSVSECRRDGNGGTQRVRTPLDPATVVAVAKKAYASLGGDSDGSGQERVKLMQFCEEYIEAAPREPSLDCPLAEDIIMIDADEDVSTDDESWNCDNENDIIDLRSFQGVPQVPDNIGEVLRSMQHENHDRNVDKNNHMTPPLHPRGPTPLSKETQAARKRRNVDWLCHNIRSLHELSQLPFNSAEMWRLHHHFFSPSIQNDVEREQSDETCNVAPVSYDSGDPHMDSTLSDDSVSHRVCRPDSTASEPCAVSPLSFLGFSSNGSSVAPHQFGRLGSPGGLGRKVSYRSLQDSLVAASSYGTSSQADRLKGRGRTISKVADDGNKGHSMQPKPKRARRNRTRISHFPRIKKKLDSSLEKCHHTALVIMRQLRFVEEAFLSAYVRKDGLTEPNYISGILAEDIEIILLDMM